MLHDIWCGLSWFFGLKAVSDYIFPIISTIYLTFFTVAVVRFLDIKRDIVRTLKQAEEALAQTPKSWSVTDCLSHAFNAFKRLEQSHVEMSEEGHYVSATAVAGWMKQFRKKVLDRVFDFEGDQKYKDVDAKFRLLLKNNPGLGGILSARDFFEQERPRIHRKIQNLTGSWQVYFQIHFIRETLRRNQVGHFAPQSFMVGVQYWF